MTTTATTADPRIYVASLSDYNAGTLHGEWINLAGSTIENIRQEIASMLALSPAAECEGCPAEEYAIHDHDGFYGLTVGEYDDLERLVDLANLLAEHGPAYAAYAENVGVEYADESGFEESYAGEYDDRRDFGSCLVDDMGMLSGVDESVARYFDYAAFTRDLFMGDYWSSPSPGGVFVFRSC